MQALRPPNREPHFQKARKHRTLLTYKSPSRPCVYIYIYTYICRDVYSRIFDSIHMYLARKMTAQGDDALRLIRARFRCGVLGPTTFPVQLGSFPEENVQEPYGPL